MHADQRTQTLARLEHAARVWRAPEAHDEAELLEALAVVLMAYGFGIDEADVTLDQIRRGRQGWRPPPRSRALVMARDVRRLAEDLRGVTSGPSPNP